MPIIQTSTNTPLSPEQLLQRQADIYSGQINNLYHQNGTLARNLANFFWADPAKAQERFNLFGSNAADLLKIAGAFVALVQTYEGLPPQIVPDGWTVSPNEDGTVTVSGPA